MNVRQIGYGARGPIWETTHKVTFPNGVRARAQISAKDEDEAKLKIYILTRRIREAMKQ